MNREVLVRHGEDTGNDPIWNAVKWNKPRDQLHDSGSSQQKSNNARASEDKRITANGLEKAVEPEPG